MDKFNICRSLIFVDHGFVRTMYHNFYPLFESKYLFRRPVPHQMRTYQQPYHVTTIVNLHRPNMFISFLDWVKHHFNGEVVAQSLHHAATADIITDTFIRSE